MHFGCLLGDQFDLTQRNGQAIISNELKFYVMSMTYTKHPGRHFLLLSEEI